MTKGHQHRTPAEKEAPPHDKAFVDNRPTPARAAGKLETRRGPWATVGRCQTKLVGTVICVSSLSLLCFAVKNASNAGSIVG
eukprot:6173895-Pleurochrysis_carterae.AAC.3